MPLITHIKKSEGRLEPINFDKLNKWVIYVDDNSNSWNSVVLDTMKRINRTTEVETFEDKTFITSKQLQNELIQTYLNHNTHKSSIKAGRLWLPMLAKDVNNNFYDKKGENVSHRHIKDLHKEYAYKELMDIDFVNSFTDEEYELINDMLSYDKIAKYLNKFTYYQIQQLMNKYAIDDNELPQYVFMRVAMSVESGNNSKNKLEHIEKLFKLFIANKINIPTPYFTNAGKKTSNYNSCCVYTTKDDVASLATGDHIAYTMTYSSAGIGANIVSRSIGEPVKGGSFKHQGKLPYYRSVVSATQANTQKGRGGSVTITYYCFDPEWESIQALKNPLTPQAKQIRNADYSMAYNTFFAKKVAENAEIALFSVKDAPEIYENIGVDIETFSKVYEQAVKEKRYHSLANAREIAVNALRQGIETGRHYYINLTETNRHTPFKELITQSNLCMEIQIITKGYNNITELYADEQKDHFGEVGLCSLAGIVLQNVENDEDYLNCAYYALRCVHHAIHNSNYVFNTVGITAKARNSAGVGMIGLAHYMAKRGLKYDTLDGRNEIHKVAERHYYMLLKVSLEISKEFGVAEYIHKTKWVDGWLPIDTYNKNTDKLHSAELVYDWERLRNEIKENGGIHNSVLVAHMPAESSSLSSGTTNGIYPIRRKSLIKNSGTDSLRYVVPDDELDYQNAYDISVSDMKKVYAIVQKFTDQAISADEFISMKSGKKVTTNELLQNFFVDVNYGNKTRYYVNQEISNVSIETGLSDSTTPVETTEDMGTSDCCSL